MRDPETGGANASGIRFRNQARSPGRMCAVVSEIKVGTYIEPSKTTFAQFLDRWLEDVRTRVTPKTHERYEQLARKNVAPLSGAIPLAKLKPEQISQAYAKALANGRGEAAAVYLREACVRCMRS